ncbi:MAG: hypothetical protein R6V85_19500 [Polyangia bacterium]
MHASDSGYPTYGGHVDNVRVEPGTFYKGARWYSGDAGESCADVCEGRGGYDEATRTVAGSDGGNVDCRLLLGTLGSGYPYAGGVGCVYVTDLSMRYRDVAPTTSSASCPTCRRACACGG